MIKKYSTMALSLCLAGATLVGCNDFLEFEPYGPTVFGTTEADIEKQLNAFGAFTYVEGVTGRGTMWFENCSDNMVTGRTQAQGDQIKNFQMSASNGRDVRKTWPEMYQLILKTNEVFRAVPEARISSELKNRALGQAHFYRGFAYLWIAPFYGDNGPNGGIPIVTENTPAEDIDQPRPASVLANYDMIIDDLRKAGELLPYLSQQPDSEYGRPHKAAAWAFAARAALYAAQYDARYYETVVEFCDKVINLTGADKRGLYPNFAQLFREENNFSEEYLFSLLGNVIEGPKFHGMSFQNGGYGIYNTWGFFQPTLELYKAFEEGDARRAATILFPNEHIQFVGRDIHFAVNPAEVSSTSGMTFRKFMSPFEPADAIGRTVSTSGNNQSNRLGTVLMRYADVLLMKAEALIWTKGEGNAEAKALLNQIRKRAGLPENSQATKAQLKNERRCELAFEFQPSRHLDLVRWGDAQEAYAKPLHGVRTVLEGEGEAARFVRVEEIEIWPARKFDPKVHHVFPIPSEEVGKSKNLKQNKGY